MSVTEKEFNAVGFVALMLWEQQHKDEAIILDELARKMNRELTGRATFEFRKHGPGLGNVKPIEIHSPLETMGLRTKRKA